MYKNYITLLIFTLFIQAFKAQNSIKQIRPFGTNPGNLKLMFYNPGNITTKAPLVVVLHGCTQTAESCAEQTGWNKLADKNGFYVLYPEQLILNNLENCFNWYRSADQSKGKGEPESIMQMIDYIKKNNAIDTTQIYITGLSAGGAMSSIMLAVYPKVFDKGAVFSGGPYKSAESVLKAGPAMLGIVSKSPEDWGNLIKEQNPNFRGNYPELVIFHGGADPVVSVNNANQLIKQWVNIHNADYEVDEHYENFKNNEAIELSVYKDKTGNDIVKYYRIKGMGHAVALDTGRCDMQGGKTGMFAINNNFYSTYWAADFFGIIKKPYSITGDTLVKANTNNLTYSVPFTEGSTYKWKTPAGVWITAGDKTNSIIVTTDYTSGFLEVTETNKLGCELKTCKLWVNVKE